MPNWNAVLSEISRCPRNDALDYIRRKYLKQLSKKTGRNIIAYYSGWLQKPRIAGVEINDSDKNGLMACIHGLDRDLGLDLLLHTPGGDIAATESIVHYLRQMFATDIRVIIPQLAMSAGTMIACASKEMVMGKQSNIGPIDPQYNGFPAHGVLAEFERALRETKEDPGSIPLWQVVISKYHPTFIGDCQHAVDLANSMVSEWLCTGMFKHESDKKDKARRVTEKLNNHNDTKMHARHIHIEEAKQIGLNVKQIETDFDSRFQDLILTTHHAFMHTLANSPAIKIIENHKGNAIVQFGNFPVQQMAQQPAALQVALQPSVAE